MQVFRVFGTVPDARSPSTSFARSRSTTKLPTSPLRLVTKPLLCQLS